MTSIRDILAGDGTGFERAIAALAGGRALPAAAGVEPVAMARALIGQVETELRATQIKDVLVGAWHIRSALREAARETVRHPGTYRQVVLRTCHIPWEHEMDLDVLVNGRKVGSLTITASVDVTVNALSAMVREGRITAVHSGDGDVVAKLTASTAAWPVRVSVPLAQARGAFDLGVEVRVPGGGVVLAAGR